MRRIHTLKSSSILPLLALGLFSLSAPIHASGLNAFLGAESFNLQKLWDGPGGTSVVVAADGSILAFEGTRGHAVLRSTDGGATWSAPIIMGSDAISRRGRGTLLMLRNGG